MTSPDDIVITSTGKVVAGDLTAGYLELYTGDTPDLGWAMSASATAEWTVRCGNRAMGGSGYACPVKALMGLGFGRPAAAAAIAASDFAVREERCHDLAPFQSPGQLSCIAADLPRGN